MYEHTILVLLKNPMDESYFMLRFVCYLKTIFEYKNEKSQDKTYL